jgi:hypothetical protein
MSDIDVRIDDDLAEAVTDKQMTQLEAIQVQTLRELQGLADAARAAAEEEAKPRPNPIRLVRKGRGG